MLIKALCDYYDILYKEGKVLSDEYSFVNVNYIICLSDEGKIENIIKLDDNKKEVMPKRSEKPGINSNIIEHRPVYIFGLNYEKGIFTFEDKTNRAKKSHEDFKKKNLEFIEGLDSPVINAYRNFILNWKPENECENKFLLELDKNYSKSNYSFCLSGEIDKPLYKDTLVIKKWQDVYKTQQEIKKDIELFQCGISGEKDEIARIHNKIKGVAGGLATGSVLIGFNNSSENSYGNEQSYNSNISKNAMNKYSKALNYLLDGPKHKKIFDEITLVYWGMSDDEKYDDLMSMLVFGDESLNVENTDNMLNKLVERAKEGVISTEEVSDVIGIDSNVDFYMIGLKPNSSRLSLKFIYKRKFADILLNIANHQRDMQITKDFTPVPFWLLKKELCNPNSKDSKISPELFTKLFESAIYGRQYPVSLLSTVIQRAKTDKNTDKNKKIDIKENRVRAGIIKAYLNRKSRILYGKEELKVSLDKENRNQAYLCGRLFAVLEKLQQDVSGNKLNTTIKDSYFSSASSKPAMVFPKIIKLAQNHLKKLDNESYVVFYNKLIGEIIDSINGEFPETLMLSDQGRFIVGYYQQYQDFFIKKEDKENIEKKEEE